MKNVQFTKKYGFFTLVAFLFLLSVGAFVRINKFLSTANVCTEYQTWIQRLRAWYHWARSIIQKTFKPSQYKFVAPWHSLIETEGIIWKTLELLCYPYNTPMFTFLQHTISQWQCVKKIHWNQRHIPDYYYCYEFP